MTGIRFDTSTRRPVRIGHMVARPRSRQHRRAGKFSLVLEPARERDDARREERSNEAIFRLLLLPQAARRQRITGGDSAYLRQEEKP